MTREYWFRSSSIKLEEVTSTSMDDVLSDEDDVVNGNNTAYYKNGKKLENDDEEKEFTEEDFKSEVLQAVKGIIREILIMLFYFLVPVLL